MTKSEIEKLAFELSRRILSRDDVPELISIDRWAKNLIKTALTEVHDGAISEAAQISKDADHDCYGLCAEDINGLKISSVSCEEIPLLNEKYALNNAIAAIKEVK